MGKLELISVVVLLFNIRATIACPSCSLPPLPPKQPPRLWNPPPASLPTLPPPPPPSPSPPPPYVEPPPKVTPCPPPPSVYVPPPVPKLSPPPPPRVYIPPPVPKQSPPSPPVYVPPPVPKRSPPPPRVNVPPPVPKLSPPHVPKPCPPPPPAFVPSPPTAGGTCPIDALELSACVDLLGGLVHIGLGDGIKETCCPVLEGLADLDAAVCLCHRHKVELLNISLILPVALDVLVTCGKNPPPGYQCPA